MYVCYTGVSVCAAALVISGRVVRTPIEVCVDSVDSELQTSGELKVLAPARPRRPRVPPGPRRLVARPPECLGGRMERSTYVANAQFAHVMSISWVFWQSDLCFLSRAPSVLSLLAYTTVYRLLSCVQGCNCGACPSSAVRARLASCMNLPQARSTGHACMPLCVYVCMYVGR